MLLPPGRGRPRGARAQAERHPRRALSARRLKGEDLYGKIGPTFGELAKDASIDDARPWLEFYRREDEVDVLVPIKPEAGG